MNGFHIGKTMTRITAPPHGANYKIKKSGYVEGVYYVDGRPVTRGLDFP